MPLSALSAPLSPPSAPSSSAGITSSSSSSMIIILILGGWSHGPLNYLKYGRHRNCIFLEPSIPMPPMKLGQCSWTDQCIMIVSLFGILSFTMYGWSRIAPAIVFGVTKDNSFDTIQNNNHNNQVESTSSSSSSSSSTSIIWFLLLFSRFVVLLFSLCMMRVWVAWIVRRSIARGVAIAKPYLKDVDIVIGFSWGGAVVAELIRLGLVGNSTRTDPSTSCSTTNHNHHSNCGSINNNIHDATTKSTATNTTMHHQQQKQPLAMLIAPTTSIISKVAMQKHDAASVIRVQDPRQVHVFHATLDQKTGYCPHGNRWKSTGVTLHWCDDNHVFLRKQSIQALTSTLDELISLATRTESSSSLSSLTNNNNNTTMMTMATHVNYKGGSIRCV